MLTGFVSGLSQLMVFFVAGIMFFVASSLARESQVAVEDMLIAIYVFASAAIGVGGTVNFMPDAATAKNAAANLFLILDTEDEDGLQRREESKMLKEGISGDIEFKEVRFKCQSRNQELLDGLCLHVEEGSKVVIVGASGCGKSTITQMLLRFYAPIEGTISINGIDIRDFDIHYLRKSFGVVSQEPALFAGSFKDNIKYNL